jgi:sterol O-acyltransferase
MASFIHGIFLYMTLYFGTVHAVANLAAELFKFADRDFYSDWWSAASYKEFFKKANHIVQNYTNKFLYCDFKRIFSRGLSKVLTFFVSGLFHDLAFFISLGSLFPGYTICMTAYGFYMTYFAKSDEKSRIFFYFLAMTILTSFYCSFQALNYFVNIGGSNILELSFVL